MTRWRAVLMTGLLLAATAACSDDSGDSGDATDTVAPTVADSPAPVDTTPATEAPTTEPAVTEAPTTVSPTGWERITAPADCMCADGDEYSFFVKHADPAKVVFFLEGGGACFSAATCKPGSNTYKQDITVVTTEGSGQGIFDPDNPENPFAGWSIVYVPYCTGDVHIGNATTDYGEGVVIEHKGFVNASTALDTMAELFPEATELFVTGESAGSVPTPLYAGMAADLLPDARITVLADGSGAYPDVPGINAAIGSAWGTPNAVPDWPENEGMTLDQWSFPGLFIQAGKHAPDIVFARHDYAYDETQGFFAGLAGIAADDLVTLIDQNETQIEASGMTLLSYITPGDSHTVLHKPEFYTETVNGVRFVDWVAALVAGNPQPDVHCTECTLAA